MPTLPALDVATYANHSPHVVILGAGASVAAFPKGERNGKQLPLMNDLTRIVGLEPLLKRARLTQAPRESFEASVVAEKFQAMVALGIANTRMKDFYDLLRLSETQEFDGETLAAAIRATFDRRGTAIPTERPLALRPGVER